MSSFNLGIIKPNRYLCEGSPNSPEELDINDLIEFVKVTPETMMEVVVDGIGLNENLIADTILCYEDSKVRYELCFVSLKDNGQEDNEEKLNGLSSYLVLGGKQTYGQTVLIKCNIKENDTCENADLTLSDVKNILFKKFVHQGIKINLNGTETFTFNVDPMEIVEDSSNWQYLEVNLFKFNLIMFVQVNPDPNKINRVATRIAGNHRIAGTVLLCTKSTETQFIDLDQDSFDKLLALATDRLSARNIEDKEEEKQVEGQPKKVKSRHVFLKNMYNQYALKCMNCSTKVDKTTSLVCSGCYRMRYLNIECQKSDWRRHRDECLFGKPTLNQVLQKRMLAQALPPAQPQIEA